MAQLHNNKVTLAKGRMAMLSSSVDYTDQSASSQLLQPAGSGSRADLLSITLAKSSTGGGVMARKQVGDPAAMQTKVPMAFHVGVGCLSGGVFFPRPL